MFFDKRVYFIVPLKEFHTYLEQVPQYCQQNRDDMRVVFFWNPVTTKYVATIKNICQPINEGWRQIISDSICWLRN